MKKFYLPYNEVEKANYVYLLMFYSIANYNKDTKRYDIITYDNLENLTLRLNQISNTKISKATLGRILQREEYRKFLEVDTKNKTIRVLNDISKCNKFVVLNEQETTMILNQGDNFLATYYLYLKYYCGYSRSKKIDTTAKQFLAACGYAITSGSYISKVSECNTFLSKNGYITITKFKDNNGYERNCYACI